MRPDHVLTAFWPITEPRPLPDLIDEALDDLPRVARTAHARIVGRPQWSIRRGQDVPGSGGSHDVLFCQVPAAKLPRPADDHRSAEHHLTAA